MGVFLWISAFIAVFITFVVLRLFLMRFDFEKSDIYFSIPKMKASYLLTQSEYAKSYRFFFGSRIRWPKSSDLGQKSDVPNRKMAWSTCNVVHGVHVVTTDCLVFFHP